MLNTFVRKCFIALIFFLNLLSEVSAMDDSSIQRKIDQLTTGVSPFRGVGAVVITRGETQFFKSGVDSIGSGAIFEIGSNTKVFTALLLAVAHDHGVIKLTDSPNRAFGEDLIPEELNKSITLKNLANHSAGLPRLPDNLVSEDPQQPYAGFDLQQLQNYIRSLAWRDPEPTTCQLAHELNKQDFADIIGHQMRKNRGCYNYSNIGSAILGHAVAKSFSQNYEDALTKHVTNPFGLIDTVITLTPGQSERKLQGYSDGNPVPSWSMGAITPAGGLHSTLSDMGIFLDGVLRVRKDSGIERAVKISMEDVDTLSTGSGHEAVGLGWHIHKFAGGSSVFWHNGGTSGFMSFMAVDPINKAALFIVSNEVKTSGGTLDPRITQAGFELIESLGR